MPADGIQGFEKLELLVVANCALRGSIPPWLSGLSQLRVLDVSWNHLSGTIPVWLGNLDSLFYLDLSSNSLSGGIPESIAQMKSLMSGNKSLQVASVENFPFFIKRNSSRQGLQYNLVSSFPPSLILSDNKLVGQILPSFGRLVDLHVLDLSWNNLSGSIPEHLSGMTSLELLYLSHNNLTGRIPNSLTNLNFLSQFDVEYNHLVGPIPTHGQCNPGLCGFQLSPCESNTTQGKEHSNAEVENARGDVVGSMAIGIGIGIGIILLVAARDWVRQKRGRRNKRQVTEMVWH